jgi:phosphoenolpyruvate phosphomutase
MTPVNPATTKRLALRRALTANRPSILVGAHDAGSALLVDPELFEGVWVSGFGVATMAHGIPDLNLVTLTEAVAAASRIDAVTPLPVLADVDNGFGGILNVMRTITEYERAGIAGICIEDNLFPKRNSLYEEATQRALIEPDQQANRLREAKNSQRDESFVVVARVESLTAGIGVDDAIHRATTYADAGADALLIHSRDRTLSDITEFLERWPAQGISTPLVCVPTLFPGFSADQLFSMGFQVSIFANQLARAAVTAMRDTAALLGRTRNPNAADEDIVPMSSLFEMVDTASMIKIEEHLGG